MGGVGWEGIRASERLRVNEQVEDFNWVGVERGCDGSN